MIEWSGAPQLGDATANANHVEFCALLSATADVSDAGFISVFDAFIDHTEHHPTEGNAQMGAVDFSPRHYRRGECDNVLVLCREAYKRAAAGGMELGRRLVAELPAWLMQYVDVMDRMMTTYLVQMGNVMCTMEHAG